MRADRGLKKDVWGSESRALAAVSYAIIDNRYYRQQGDTYIYLEQPPAYR